MITITHAAWMAAVPNDLPPEHPPQSFERSRALQSLDLAILENDWAAQKTRLLAIALALLEEKNVDPADLPPQRRSIPALDAALASYHEALQPISALLRGGAAAADEAFYTMRGKASNAIGALQNAVVEHNSLVAAARLAAPSELEISPATTEALGLRRAAIASYRGDGFSANRKLRISNDAVSKQLLVREEYDGMAPINRLLFLKIRTLLDLWIRTQKPPDPETPWHAFGFLEKLELAGKLHDEVRLAKDLPPLLTTLDGWLAETALGITDRRSDALKAVDRALFAYEKNGRENDWNNNRSVSALLDLKRKFDDWEEIASAERDQRNARSPHPVDKLRKELAGATAQPELPALGISQQQWLERTAVKWLRRSGELQEVDAALKAYEEGRSASNFARLKRTFAAWQRLHEDSQRDPDSRDKLKAAIKEISDIRKRELAFDQADAAARLALRTAQENALKALFTGDLSMERPMRERWSKRSEVLQPKLQARTLEFREEWRTEVKAALGVMGKWVKGAKLTHTIIASGEPTKKSVRDALLPTLPQHEDREQLRDEMLENVGQNLDDFSEMIADVFGATPKLLKNLIVLAKTGSERYRTASRKAVFRAGDATAAFDAVNRLLERKLCMVSKDVVAGAVRTLGHALPGIGTAMTALVVTIAEAYVNFWAYAEMFKEVRLGNELLAQMREGAWPEDPARTLFGASPVLGCYFLVLSDTSNWLDIDPDDMGSEDWAREVEYLRQRAHLVIAKALDFIQSSPYVLSDKQGTTWEPQWGRRGIVFRVLGLGTRVFEDDRAPWMSDPLGWVSMKAAWLSPSKLFTAAVRAKMKKSNRVAPAPELAEAPPAVAEPLAEHVHVPDLTGFARGTGTVWLSPEGELHGSSQMPATRFRSELKPGFIVHVYVREQIRWDMVIASIKSDSLAKVAAVTETKVPRGSPVSVKKEDWWRQPFQSNRFTYTSTALGPPPPIDPVPVVIHVQPSEV